MSEQVTAGTITRPSTVWPLEETREAEMTFFEAPSSAEEGKGEGEKCGLRAPGCFWV